MSTKQLSFPREKIKILLLEGVHQAAADRFKELGYNCEIIKKALGEEELIKAIPSVHILGIRSKTQVSEKVLAAAQHLVAMGCFCIGTNQVNLSAASGRGVPVFNAPFSNTRSVAELAIAEIIMLARRASHKNVLLHQGKWDKSANGCFEVRNKTLGIVGYGHIGGQVGILAEAFGMQVVYFDIVSKLALGNAQSVSSLDELLKVSDFVTLHVPETAETKGMIGKAQLDRMKASSCLLNLSRGTVVDIESLVAALKAKKLAGAGIDVFPEEPESNDQEFLSNLRGLDNVILTPHIGGSTEEAQRNIALEVATVLAKYSDTGSTGGAVNFPQIELPIVRDSHRILNIHRNVPGVMRDITQIISETGANIRSQYLGTQNDVGYLIMDVDQELSLAVRTAIEALPASIKTRVLF